MICKVSFFFRPQKQVAETQTKSQNCAATNHACWFVENFDNRKKKKNSGHIYKDLYKKMLKVVNKCFYINIYAEPL